MTIMHTRRRAPRGSRRGVSIVEVMASLLVLSVGILGLSSSAATVTRLMDRGDQQTTAAMMVQDRMERLRATRCPLASGSASLNGMTERWSVSGPIAAGGRGYQVVDSVLYKVRGVAKPPLVYRSIVECLP
jgi:Tfp pilus assembly protein PilV